VDFQLVEVLFGRAAQVGKERDEEPSRKRKRASADFTDYGD
jgi:hypothetical protein